MKEGAALREQLNELMNQLRNKEIGPLAFLMEIHKMVGQMEGLTDEDLQGITPLVLNIAQRLVRVMERKGM